MTKQSNFIEPLAGIAVSALTVGLFNVVTYNSLFIQGVIYGAIIGATAIYGGKLAASVLR